MTLNTKEGLRTLADQGLRERVMYAATVTKIADTASVQADYIALMHEPVVPGDTSTIDVLMEYARGVYEAARVTRRERITEIRDELEALLALEADPPQPGIDNTIVTDEHIMGALTSLYAPPPVIPEPEPEE